MLDVSHIARHQEALSVSYSLLTKAFVSLMTTFYESHTFDEIERSYRAPIQMNGALCSCMRACVCVYSVVCLRDSCNVARSRECHSMSLLTACQGLLDF